MNGFRSDNEVLANRAGEFAGLSERADRILADLNTQLEANADCWGADAAGQAFAAGHVEAADSTLTGIGLLPGGLRAIGVRLAQTAATYAETDHAGGDTIRSAGRDLD